MDTIYEYTSTGRHIYDSVCHTPRNSALQENVYDLPSNILRSVRPVQRSSVHMQVGHLPRIIPVNIGATPFEDVPLDDGYVTADLVVPRPVDHRDSRHGREFNRSTRKERKKIMRSFTTRY